MGLVIGVDIAHRDHAGIGFGTVGAAAGFHMPVENAPDEGRDQEGPGRAASHGLNQRKQQCQVAVDALALEDFCRFDPFPGRGDLDQDFFLADAARRIGGNDGAGLVDGRCRIEGEVGIDFGRDAPWHDPGELGAKGNRQTVADRMDSTLPLRFAPGNRLIDNAGIGRVFDSLQDQRRIRCAINRFEAPDGFDITGIGNHSCHRS